MPPLSLALCALLSYLIGAVPFGYLIARARGVDILHAGSGNIGATNVGRLLGRRFGALVFLLDFAKGALPVAAASWLSMQNPDVAAYLGPDGLPVLAPGVPGEDSAGRRHFGRLRVPRGNAVLRAGDREPHRRGADHFRGTQRGHVESIRRCPD